MLLLIHVHESHTARFMAPASKCLSEYIRYHLIRKHIFEFHGVVVNCFSNKMVTYIYVTYREKLDYVPDLRLLDCR